MQSIKILGRLSYPALDKMTKMSFGKGETSEYFGADIILPKDDPQVKAFNTVLEQAVRESFPDSNVSQFIAQAKAKGRAIIRDGNEKIANSSKPEVYERAYRNHWYISAKNKLVQPLLVDRQANIVSNPREVFYAGCWVYAKLNIIAYELESYKTKGFSCTLTGVQFFKNDERWGATPKADSSDFEVFSEEENSPHVTTFASADVDTHEGYPF